MEQQTSKVFMNGQMVDIDMSAKAITTIPGWANLFAESGGRSDPLRLAVAYEASIWSYRCIKTRSNALSSINWEIREHVGNEFEVTKDSDVEFILREVNPEINWIDLIRATESDMLIYGRAYWLKIRGQNSQSVVALRRLNPLTMEAITDAEGISGFVQTIEGHQKETFNREDVVYFREYDPQDDLGAVSATQVALDAINALINTKKYVAAFFKNNAVPRLLLTPKDTMQTADIQKSKSVWERVSKGTQNQHKTLIMNQAFNVVKLDYPINDLALKEVEESARRDISAAYEVPPTLAGAWEASNYATAKEEHVSFYTDTVIPRADYLASVINAELVSIEFGREFEFSWRYSELPIFEVDINTETERVISLVEAGVITPDVAAQELGYPVDVVPQVVEDLTVQDQAEVADELDDVEEETEVIIEAQSEPTKTVINVEPDDEDFFMEDLKKFYVKSKKRLQNGKSPVCEFKSDYIPAQLMAAIKAQLETVENNTELMAIFDDVRNNKEVWGTYP